MSMITSASSWSWDLDSVSAVYRSLPGTCTMEESNLARRKRNGSTLGGKLSRCFVPNRPVVCGREFSCQNVGREFLTSPSGGQSLLSIPLFHRL